MNCRQVEALVARHCDGELPAPLSRFVDWHLRGCAGCRTRQRGIVELGQRIRAEAPYFEATPALRARVGAMLGAMHASHSAAARPTTRRWGWMGGGVLAGCALSAFAWMLGTTLIAARAADDLAVAAVDTHVRAARDAQLIEVASSDRHTVKPWLSARIDYSPPVQDLASEGFPLLGGRLDMIEGRPVATLVYGYRHHTIDVFVRPEAWDAPVAHLRTVRGFNVARASGPSMDWLAVSDAEPEVLAAFVQRVAREDVAR